MKKTICAIPGLNRDVGLFLTHTAIYQFGLFGISDVVLNFYFVSLGHSAETISMLQALSRVGGIFTGLPLGMLADRVGPRRVTIYAMLFGASSYIPLLVWPTLPILMLSRFLFGIAFGAAFIAASPLMVSLARPEHRTHLFSYRLLVGHVMTFLGSVVGGFLPALIVLLIPPPMAGDIPAAQTPFAYGAALAIGGIAVGASLIPMLALREPPGQAEKIPGYNGILRPSLSSIPWQLLVYLYLPFMLFGLTAGLTFPFYNLFFRVTFKLPDEAIGTILGIAWLGMGLFTGTAPRWNRRFGRVTGLGIAMLISGAAFLVLGAAASLVVAIPAFIVAVSTRNLMGPLYLPMAMEAVSPALRNFSSGLGYVLWSVGWFVASWISGFLQENYGFGFIMNIVAVGTFLTGLSVFIIFRNRHPYDEPGAAQLDASSRIKGEQ